MPARIPPKLNDVDRRIWAEELDAFVPPKVFDVHTHVYRWALCANPNEEAGACHEPIGRDYPESDWAALASCDAALMPRRRVHRLCFPFPFPRFCDLGPSNRFAAEQAARDRDSGALMLVEPSMTAEEIEKQIAAGPFLGLKPYRFYAKSGDPFECRITDFLPEHQIAVADRKGLIIMLHLAKRDGIADPENLDDLRRLTREYPAVRWILAHCARSYSAWRIERAAAEIGALGNVWYDTSSVCESEAVEALYAAVGADRVMFGSDDLPVGVMRGKYVTFGYSWAFLSEDNHRLDVSHCDGRMTFTRYEQLRAMHRAALRLRLTQGQIEDLFYNTASRLVQSARSGGRIA